MAVKGSKNTKQRGVETKAGMMNKESGGESSNENSSTETNENAPKTSKKQSEKRDTDEPLH